VRVRSAFIVVGLLTGGGGSGFGVHVAAQDAPVQRVTLEEAKARALAASHRVAELRARELAAQASVAGRQALERPVVSAIAGYTRTNHVLEFTVPTPAGPPRVIYPDIPDNYRTRIDLQWPIYTGGRADALERAAQAEAGAVTADVATAQAELRLEVTRAFWAAVTAQASLGVLDRSLTRAQARVTDARERLAAGLVPPNDVASAEAQHARQRMLSIEAANQRALALADLARLTGADPRQALEPAATLESERVLAQPVDTLVAEGQAARSERRALDLRVASAEAQGAAAAAAKRPMVVIGAGADYARPNPRIFPRVGRWEESWDAGVNVTWSLWDGGRAAADVAQASHLAEAGRQRLQEFDSLLALEVRQRTLDIDSGRATVAAADEGVRAATEAHRVVTERYRAGVITQTEVLDAEVALLQAELDRTRALAGVRLAEARLERAVGR
jgi:outer membrane protein TolC